jgi:hypothetical protein
MPRIVGRRAETLRLAVAGRREDTVIKLGELVMILDLHRQDLSVSALAQQLGVDRKTVTAYIAKGLEPPVCKKRAARPSRDVEIAYCGSRFFSPGSRRPRMEANMLVVVSMMVTAC